MPAASSRRPSARGRSSVRRDRRRAAGVRWAARLLVLALAFFVGLAVGKAVEDAPRPGGTQTRIRTIEPLTVPPQDRTVTVTTSGR